MLSFIRGWRVYVIVMKAFHAVRYGRQLPDRRAGAIQVFQSWGHRGGKACQEFTTTTVEEKEPGREQGRKLREFTQFTENELPQRVGQDGRKAFYPSAEHQLYPLETSRKELVRRSCESFHRTVGTYTAQRFERRWQRGK